MTISTLRTAVLTTFLALSGFATEATAQRVDFRLGSHGRRGGVGLHIGLGHDHRAHRHSDCCRRWVPGCERIIEERIWVEGGCRQVWIEPIFETRCDPCGRRYQVCVRPGHWDSVRDPGHFEVVQRRVREPGRFEYVCGY